jgi:acyl carrier protein
MLLEEFRDLVVTQLLAQLPDKAAGIQALTNDDDLLGSGLVDSYAFIDLCLAIEATTGANLDIGTLEPEQFGSIAALYELVIASSRNPVSMEARYDRGLLA